MGTYGRVGGARGGVRRLVGGGLVMTLVAVTLAIGAGTASPEPAAAAEALVAVDIAATGNGACAATEDEEVWCWGEDWNGFLGNGTGGTLNGNTGWAVSPVKASTTGEEVGTGCARTGAGVVQCWGYTGTIEDGEGSRFSQPPWGSNTPRDYGHGTAVEIAGRCALRTDGTVACQGWDNWGQVGRGGIGWPGSGHAHPPPSAATAVGVSGLSGVVDISSINSTMCAVKGDGTVWCWGWGFDGQLGNGRSIAVQYPCPAGPCQDSEYASTPVQVPGITDAVAIDGPCARRTGGAVTCWGTNNANRYLTGSPTTTVLGPTEIPAFAGAVDLEVSRSATCAVFADGTATCQGRGHLGDGVRSTATATVDVDLNGRAAENVAVGSDSWCVRYTSGRLDCWGDNTSGQLGIGGRGQAVLSPTLVVGFTGRDLITGALFELGSGGDIVKEGEATTIRLRVENLTDTTLTDVAVVGTSVTAIDDTGEGAATIGPQPGGQSPAGSLGPRSDGTHLDFADFAVNPTTAGEVRLAVTVTATGTDGSVEQEVLTYDLTIEPAPLLVELTARPAGSTEERGAGEPFEFLLHENDHDDRFEVDVTVTNQGDEPVESIDFLDPEAPIDLDSLLVDEEGNPVPGVAITPLDDPAPDLPAHDLDPGEAMTQTYRFEGVDEAHAELSSIVQGRMGDDAVSGRGVVEVKVQTDVLVEFGMKASRPGPYVGGHVIRLDGRIENVSEDTTVGVVAYPTTTGNAGNGNVFCPAGPGNECPVVAREYGEGPGRTPEGPVPMILAPGQDVPLEALLITTELPVGGTATVEWEVHVWKHEPDEDTGAILKNLAAETQLKILDDEGLDDRIEVFVPATEQLPDVIGGECQAESQFLYIGCGVLVGVERLGQSLFALARLATTSGPHIRMLAWSAEYLGRLSVALQTNPEARQAIIDEMVAEMQGYVDVGAAVAANLPTLAHDAVVGFIDRWVTIYRTGNYEALSFELGRMAGENPDLVVGAVAMAARVGRKLLNGASLVDDPIKVAVREAEEIRTGDLPADLAAAERAADNGGPPVHRAGVLQHGDDVTPRMIGDYWAGDPRDVETAFQLTDSEQVLLTFASRVDEAADAVRAGIAWPTPRELPLSAVDDIDVDYLGYPSSRKGFADMAQPPRDFPTDTYMTSVGDCCFNTLGDDAIRAASVDWVRRNHPGLDPAMAERVASRLQTRVNEFIAGYNRLVEAHRPTGGPGGTVYEVPVGSVDPATVFGAGPSAPRVVRDERGLRLAGRTDDEFGPAIEDPDFITDYANGTLSPEQMFNGPVVQEARLYFEMSFDATGTGAYRPMVDGGVELVAVTGLDGRRILDEGKRARVYEKLQHTLGMRNGELPDWVATGQVDPLRASVADDALTVTVGPGRRAKASGFVENTSVLPGTPNAGVSAQDFVMIIGYGYRWLHEPTGPGPFSRPSHFSALTALFPLPHFFVLGSLWQFVDGMAGSQVPPGYDRDSGANVRPDGDGGLETYDPSGGDGNRAATGAWTPISLADALALGDDPDTLELSPASVVISGLAGSTELDIATPDELGVPASTDWFAAGDRIVVDPGGPNEERVTIASVSPSLVLTTPLAREHLPGEYVVLETTTAARTPNERFVLAAYRDLLDRAPTPEELQATAARLDGGTRRSVVATELARSTEWVGALVDRYYADTLDRAPDAAGRAYWIDEIRTRARTPAQVAAAFYSSPEYFRGLGGGTVATWVTDLYRSLLGRSPDEAGRLFWIDATAERGRGWVARRFYDSIESRRRRVPHLYVELLGRSPEAAGLAYWAPVIGRTGDDVGLAIHLVSSREYFERAQGT